MQNLLHHDQLSSSFVNTGASNVRLEAWGRDVPQHFETARQVVKKSAMPQDSWS